MYPFFKDSFPSKFSEAGVDFALNEIPQINMNKNLFIFFCLISLLQGCFLGMDRVYPFYKVINNSKNSVRVCFSQKKEFDTTLLRQQYFVLKCGDSIHPYLDDKELIHLTNEKLAFVQVFNEDTIRMILNEKKIISLKLISERTFIQSRQIDISSIGGKDTLQFISS